MKNLLCALGAFLIFGTAAAARAEERLKIVATLPSFADIASAIGGELVDVVSIGAPRFNPHFIEAKPSDVLRLKKADLYIHSGLDLEAWSGPLVDAAARPELRKGGKQQLDLSQGINLLEVPTTQVSRAEGDIHLYGNPHYWLDPRNGLQMAKTIATKLCEIDPPHRTEYLSNLERFSAKLQNAITDWQAKVAPYRGQKLVGYHNEWIYLMAFTGLRMEQFLEPKPGIPPSPGHIVAITDYIKQEGVRAVVQSTFYPRDAADDIAARTGIKVLLLCQNVHEIPQAEDYVAMIDYNIRSIVEVLSHD